jgi:hypothetical protein
MWFSSLAASWNSRFSRNRSPRRRRAHAGWGFTSELLEERRLLSAYIAADVSSLIADINAANKAGGTNTITLTAPSNSPYVLSKVNNTGDGPTALPVISGGSKNVAADNLTIIGNGDTIERSTGAPAFRLFDVASGSSLTLENLTLQNGLLTGGSGASAEGGAIYNQGTLVLSGVSVQDNEIVAAAGAYSAKSKSLQPGSDAAGGGIWSDGSLTLKNGTTIQNNSAVGGVGAASAGQAAGGGNAFGGGLYVAGGTASISSATVSGNTARGGTGGSGGKLNGAGGNASGGAVYVAAGQVTVTVVSLNSNSAQGGTSGQSYTGYLFWGGNAFGGGISVAGGSVSLSSDSVESNSATGGPGDSSGVFESAFGGGIYVAGGNMNLSSDTVEYNSAIGNDVYGAGVGGGIFITSTASSVPTVTLSSDMVEFNTTQHGLTGGGGNDVGGGIEIDGGTVYIDTATVANSINNTDDSGLNGISANIDGSYTLQNS